MIVEAHRKRRQRRAVATTVTTVGIDNPQGRKGLKAERLDLRRRQRPFRRGRTGANVDGDRRVGGKFLFGTEGQPATLLNVLHIAGHVGIGGDLRFGGQTNRVCLTAGQDLNRLQHGCRLDRLIKGDKEQWIQRLGAEVRIDPLHRWRRGAERPAHGLWQHTTVGRLGSGRDFSRELGGHGETIEFLRVILEGERGCAQPFPDALQGRCQRNRHIRGGKFVERRQRHHGLIEGHVEERCDRDLAFGRVTQDLEIASGDHRWNRPSSRRRKRFVDSLACSWRWQRSRRQLELLHVAGLNLQGRQSIEDRLDFGVT